MKISLENINMQEGIIVKALLDSNVRITDSGLRLILFLFLFFIFIFIYFLV